MADTGDMSSAAGRWTFADLVRGRGPLRWDEAIGFVVLVSDTLAQYHDRGILHQEIRPENILFDGTTPKLEFGVARTTGGGQQSPSWWHAAPESLNNRRDERSDLYSLASTLYYLLTGYPPFRQSGSESESQAMMRLASAPAPTLPAHLGPPELAAFVTRALAKDPAARFQNARDFSAELRRIAQSAGHSGLPAGTVTQFAPPGQPSPAQPSPPQAPPPQSAAPPTVRVPAVGAPGALGASGTSTSPMDYYVPPANQQVPTNPYAPPANQQVPPGGQYPPPNQHIPTNQFVPTNQYVPSGNAWGQQGGGQQPGQFGAGTVAPTRREGSSRAVLIGACCLAAVLFLGAVGIIIADGLGGDGGDEDLETAGSVTSSSTATSESTTTTSASEESTTSTTVEETSTTETTAASSQPISVFDLDVGDCITDDLGEDDVSTVSLIACDAPHVYEVYHVFDITDLGDEYPGEVAVDDASYAGCDAQFEDFTGEAWISSAYDFTYLLPSDVTWDTLDDREVTCMLYNFDGTAKTGSAGQNNI